MSHLFKNDKFIVNYGGFECVVREYIIKTYLVSRTGANIPISYLHVYESRDGSHVIMEVDLDDTHVGLGITSWMMNYVRGKYPVTIRAKCPPLQPNPSRAILAARWYRSCGFTERDGCLTYDNRKH